MHYDPARGFFVADCFWLPPDGDPIGPMALEITCIAVGTDPAGGARVRVRQTGYEDSVRWRRYYQVVGLGWERALGALRSLLER